MEEHAILQEMYTLAQKDNMINLMGGDFPEPGRSYNVFDWPAIQHWNAGCLWFNLK